MRSFLDMKLRQRFCSEPALLAACLAAAALFGTIASQRARSQVFEREISARARLFPEVGPSLRAIKRDATGRYYVLNSPGAAVNIFRPDGKRLGQLPAAPTNATGIVYGEDLDVGSGGKVYVADRGANAVKIYNPDGKLALAISVAAPTSVAALPDGEVAVASLKSNHLVQIFDAEGQPIRDFGDLSEVAQRAELNQYLNIGRLATDTQGHIYYAFSYLPEPTVRKYDRYGYAAFEISLATLEFEPAAQAERRSIWRQDQRGGAPNLKKVISAIGVDAQTEEIWLTLGDELLHFDRDGNKLAEYRMLTPDGSDLNATAILVEPHRLLLADDPQGIFDFTRPDQIPPGKTKP